MKKKALIIAPVFYPDHSGIAVYASDFAKFLQEEAAFDVKVVTSFPFYPNWRKRKEDKWKVFRSDWWGDINILRGYTYVPENPTTLKRFYQEVLLFLCSIFNVLRCGKTDVTIVFTTPISFGILGIFSKILFRSKLIINVQDFQLEAAKSLGMANAGFIFNVLEKVEKITYTKADIVSSISYSMIELLKLKRVNRNKIVYWPNWITIENEKKYVGSENSFLDRYPRFLGKKIVAYAGNVGLKQGLEVLIDAAKEVEQRSEFVDIQFLIIGDGAHMDNLKNYASVVGATNLEILPFLDSSEYNDLLKVTSLFFISQKKTSNDIYFPSKLLGIMKAKVPLIVSADADSELYKVLRNEGAAITTDYGDPSTLYREIVAFFGSDSIKEDIVSRANLLVQKFERNKILKEITNKINLL